MGLYFGSPALLGYLEKHVGLGNCGTTKDSTTLQKSHGAVAPAVWALGTPLFISCSEETKSLHRDFLYWVIAMFLLIVVSLDLSKGRS